MMKTPKEIMIAHLEVVVMPNGEVICGGNSIGWVSKMEKFLTPVAVAAPRRPKRTRGAV